MSMTALEGLTAEQQTIVKEYLGTRLVLAVPGSGKTRTICHQIRHMLDCGIPRSKIKAITFTNAAAKEMVSRISCASKELFVGTFHALGYRVLRRYGSLIGLKKDFSILDEASSGRVWKDVCRQQKADPDFYTFEKASGVRITGSETVPFLREDPRIAKDVLEISSKKMVDMLAAYTAEKAANNVLDFDDLELCFLELLEKNPEVARRMLQSCYILVDEMQDTNLVEFKLIAQWLLYTPNITLVGDVGQSIYRFRWAEVKNVTTFIEQYHPRQYNLSLNFRSLPPICAAAKRIMQAFPTAFLDVPIVPVREKTGERVLDVIGRAFHDTTASYAAGVIAVARAQEEPLSSFAILVRRRNHTLAFETALTDRRTPYKVVGAMRFFARDHIRKTLAMARVLTGRGNMFDWEQVLSMLDGWGKVTVQRCVRGFAAQGMLFEKVNKRQEASLLAFQAQSFKTEDPGSLVDSIRQGFMATFICETYKNFEERLEDVFQLQHMAQNVSSLEDFFDMTVLGTEEDEGGDKVTISTCHAAKGKEWKHVFIAHVTKGVFPDFRCANQDDFDDEARLFYVSVTRAKDSCTLLIPDYEYLPGGRDMSGAEVSVFVQPFMAEMGDGS